MKKLFLILTLGLTLNSISLQASEVTFKDLECEHQMELFEMVSSAALMGISESAFKAEVQADAEASNLISELYTMVRDSFSGHYNKNVAIMEQNCTNYMMNLLMPGL